MLDVLQLNLIQLKGEKVLSRFVLAALLLLFACTDTGAAPWFSDSFDSYSTGNLTGQGGWTGASGPVRVETTFVQSGKAVQANYKSWGVGDVSRAVSSGAGYHYIEFDAAQDVAGSGGTGTNVGYLKIFNQSGSEITRFYYGKGQFKVLLGPASQTPIIDGVVSNRWYHVRIGINLSTSLMDVWVDGEQRVASAAVYGSGTSIGSLVFGQWNQGTLLTTASTYIDNIACSSPALPPPGSALQILGPKYFPGWQAFNVLYPFVIYDESSSQYRMYYSGSEMGYVSEAAWDQWATGSATSVDTLKWTYPDNYEAVIYPHKFMEGDVVDPDDIKTEFDSVMAIAPCVIKDGSTYKMWYTGWNGDSEHIGNGITRKISYRIGYATSADGVHWTKHLGTAGVGAVFGVGTVGSLDAKGVSHPYVIKENNTYRMWYEGYDGSAWRIFYATSADGVTWTRQGLALNTSANGSYDTLAARNPVVIRRNGVYEMWYQGQGTVMPQYHVLRATSPDGITWTKISGQVALHPDAAIQGTERIHVNSILVQHDGSCQVFFAKESTSTRSATFGSVYQRLYYIYTEVVNP